MPYPSRYIRRARPPDCRLQQRDLRIFEATARYGFLTSAHVHDLAFPRRTLKVAQCRLRKLWDARYLDRVFVPIVLDGGPPRTSRPLYRITHLGVRALRAAGVPFPPTTRPRRRPRPDILLHDLVATDFLVAVEVGSRDHQAVSHATITTEPELRSAVGATPPPRGSRARVVSDGAFTLHAGGKAPMSFHIEVVRASVRGGNQTLRRKLERYVSLNHDGHFARVHGQHHLRAVLLLTTSPKRAQHFVRLIDSLKHGKHLFWATHYSTALRAGVHNTGFSAREVFTHRFVSTGGLTRSLDGSSSTHSSPGGTDLLTL